MMAGLDWMKWPPLKAARRAGRRLVTHLRESRATLVYHLDYEMPPNPLVDPKRAEKIINYLVREGCVTSRQLRRPEAVSFEQLARVHDYRYLEQVGHADTLDRVFGIPVQIYEYERIIDVQRRQVAGTVLAARLAVKPWRRGRPVVNLGGGLHHARADGGAGFCIFNDLAVAIRQLRSEGYAGRILVVDLDLHHGDGTRAIFAADESVFTFSVHSADWDDSPAVACLDVSLGSSVGDQTYLKALREHLPRAFAEAAPELVFYVAGVDIGMEDKMGSWRVTAEGMLARDQLVLEHLGERSMVWTLAGGYGDEAWRYTARSLAWLLADLDAPILSALERELRHFRRIAQQFTRAELSGGSEEDLVITPEDLMMDLVGPSHRTKLLGYYSLYGVELSLERFGVLSKIRAAGYPRVQVELDTRHSTGERLRVRSKDVREDLLVELVIRVSSDVDPYRCLSIEWLLLQNPRAQPTVERPLLPGQQYPGLGCLGEVVMTLVMMCERLELDGLIFSPAHYHVAAQAHGLLNFLDPVDEARYAAINAAVTQMDLARATQLVHSGSLVDEQTGEPVRWKSVPMALPVSTRLKERFEGAEYERSVMEAASRLRLRRPR
jgi:acetoin utilization deacetylase AcuC-like enzyme